jgi:hypothetical protein
MEKPKVNACLSLNPPLPFQMTKIVIRNGSIRFLGKPVKKEILKLAMAAPTVPLLLGSICKLYFFF